MINKRLTNNNNNNTMKKLILLFLMLVGFLSYAQVKIGDNPTNIGASSSLELESTNKALVVTRVANTGAIHTPVNGMIIYDNSTACFKVYQNGAWSNCISITPTRAQFSAIDCNVASTGNDLIKDQAVTGVTQSINVTVSTIGSYNIVAMANGVTFSASGEFYNTGNQTIVLTATGTPNSVGTATFALNTTPACSFDRTIVDSSSGGTAVVSNYVCDTASTGTMTVGTPVSGVTQTITATVTTLGTYNITTTTNGLTFTGSGTFAGTGAQAIVLTAIGTPTTSGNNSFTLSTTPGCTFDRTVNAITPIVSSLDCTGLVVVNGPLISGTLANNISVSIPYTGGNGLAYATQPGINSTGDVLNLVATLQAGTISNGTGGTLVLTITGTPSSSGNATFAFNFGGQSCLFTVPVQPAAAVASFSSCATATAGTIVQGTTYTSGSGVTQTATYTGANAGTYVATSFPATGVMGNLTAKLAAGTLASGAGTIVFSIEGQATSSGTATFNINLFGTSCSFTRTVNAPAATITGLTSCASPTVSAAITQNISASGTTVSIGYTGGNSQSYSAGAPINSTGVSGLQATLQAGTLTGSTGSFILNLTGTPTTSGTANFAFSFGGQSCTIAVPVAAFAGIPTSITLAQTQRQFIASVNDSNYLPFTAPTGPATSVTPSNPDGTSETAVNIQGALTTTGITFTIPTVGAPTAIGTLPAYSVTVNVPASLTEDGIARDVSFSWASQSYTTASRSITANIKAVGGTLNIKKLDINTGIGNDNLGVLLASLIYPFNSSGNTTTCQLRGIPGIPDRNFADADHRMLYLPVTGADGKTWLNNNLGAHYANTASAHFNPTQQATAFNDWRAYGSLFQWGRNADDHEIINWTSATAGTVLRGTTTTRPNADQAATSNFITINSGNYDWRGTTQNNNLWQGLAGINNPCPEGFRVPTNAELTTWVSAAGVTNYTNAASSSLRLSAAGYRNTYDGSFNGAASNGSYWSSSVSGTNASLRGFDSGSTSTAGNNRAYGFSVRCLQ